MKIFAIRNDAWHWHSETSFFHSLMFHGDAVHRPARKGCPSHTFGESKMVPMRLIVNGFQLADIFLPFSSYSLIVTFEVLNRIQPLLINKCSFLPVTFEKVFYLPWSRGKEQKLPVKIIKFCENGKEKTILKECPHDASASKKLQPYYEIVAPNHYKLNENYSPTHRFFTKWYEGEPSDIDLLPVSESLFLNHPITHAGFPIVREDIFQILSPYFNRDFFGTKEFDFSK